MHFLRKIILITSVASFLWSQDYEVDKSQRALRTSYIELEPLTYMAPDDIFIDSKFHEGSIEFVTMIPRTSTALSIMGTHRVTEFLVADTDSLSVRGLGTDQENIGIVVEQPWRQHALRFGFWRNSKSAPDSIRLDYSYNLPWGKLDLSYASLHHVWDIMFEAPGEEVPITADQQLRKFGGGISFASHSYFLELNGSTTLKVLNKPEQIHPTNFRLTPVRRESTIGLGKILSNDRKLGLHFYSLNDTLNTGIYRDATTVGSIYAFDRLFNSIGLKYQSNQMDVGVYYYRKSAEISGSVLAYYFSNRLSSLSGARYFQKVQIEAEYLDIKLTYRSPGMSIGTFNVSNSLLIGTGTLYSRSYAFVLFKPIDNLNIREITAKYMILDKIRVSGRLRILNHANLLFSWNYLIPIAWDIQSEPAMDVGEVEITAMRSLELELEYLF